jgi:hypothetical protein
MNRDRWEEESRFLERVASYGEEYRSGRTAAVNEERERRHASGEVYIAGCWVPRSEAGKVSRDVQRHEVLTFFEIVVLLAVLLGLAQGLWQLFTFFFLPQLGR